MRKYLLNSKNFVVYDIDTNESILNRIALQLRTIPDFVYISEIHDLSNLKDGENIIATSLQKDIEDEYSKNYNQNFTEFYNLVKNRYPNVSFETMLHLWLHRQDIDEKDYEPFVMYEYISHPTIGNIDLKYIYTTLEYGRADEISQFITEQAATEEQLKKIDNDVIPVLMDDLKPVKTTFKVAIKLDIDLVEIFDKMVLSLYVPYVNHGNDRHKIYRDFKFTTEGWKYGLDDFLQFFVLNTRYPLTGKFNEKLYSQCVLFASENPNEAIMDIETVIGSGLNINDIIDRIFDTIKIPKIIISQNEHNISLTMNIPKQSLDKYILTDLIAIDPAISAMCYTDESINVGKKRNNVSFFYKALNLPSKAHITIKEVITDNKLHHKNPELYPQGSTFLQVNINKVENKSMVENIALFICKIISVYNTKKHEIIAEYQKFIPSFGQSTQKVTRVKTNTMRKLTEILPNIFQSGYPRSCNHPPTIIDHLVDPTKAKDFVVTNPAEGYTQALLFPRYGDYQHWYGCNHKDFPYIGIKKNTLSNKDIYPYLPCCYKDDQTGRGKQTGKKNYNTYYLDYVNPETTESNYIKTSSKFLKAGEVGTLPSNLEGLFKTFSQLQFLRIGIDPTPKSFFSCIAKAMNKSTSGINENYFTMCRQNAHDILIEDLYKNFKDKDYYIDPSIYYRAFEEYFKCYIYIFSRTENGQGCIIRPRYKHFLLRYKNDPKRPIVLIFEHMGSEIDNATIPRCELIIGVNINKEQIYNFQGVFANEIDNIYTQTLNWEFKSFNSNNIDPTLLFPNIVAQSFDPYGKVRVLVIKHAGGFIRVITDPLPPLPVKEVIGYGNNTKEAIQKFIKSDSNIKVLNFTEIIYTIEYKGLIYTLPYGISDQSKLQDFNKKQRVARYLQEYIYFMYSRYINPREPNVDEINDFLKKNTIVKENYVYPDIPRKFNLNGKYMSGGKLIVPSLETAQRLGYGLEMYILRNRQGIKNYANNELIQEYYLDKNDYTSQKESIIFTNVNALQDWVDEKEEEFKLQTIPTYRLNKFYLKIEGKTNLIQLCDSMQHAVGVSKKWIENGVNDPQTEPSNSNDYTYYAFETPEKVVKYGSGKYKFLMWKEDDIVNYGAILNV